jgi:hypothetical protein
MKANAETANVELGADGLNSISLAQEYHDKDQARERLKRLCWPNGAVFPHCQNSGNAAKGFYPL